MSRLDRVLSNHSLPDMHHLDSVKFYGSDILLVAAGFEDRVTAVLESAEIVGPGHPTLIEIDYLPLINQNKSNCDTFNKINWGRISIEYDRRSPAGFFEKVQAAIPKQHSRIFIDISGMSRLLIIQLITGFLLDPKATPHISVLYTEALYYSPSKDEAEARLKDINIDSDTALSFISSGVSDLAIVPELSSLNANIAPIRLIGFPSFNPTQLISARSTILPAAITFLHGVPPSELLQWRPVAISKINHLADEGRSEDVSVSTLYYQETLEALLKIYSQYSSFNSLVVCPTGSKMQSVAVGIFRAFVKDVQIVYPTPLKFTNPDDHTTGKGKIHLLELDSFAALLLAFHNDGECTSA